MKTLIVTGGIATGKSTAIRLLMEEGGPRLRLFDLSLIHISEPTRPY